MQNPFVIKAMASRSINDDPLQKFKFQVTMSGMPAGAGFSKVGGASFVCWCLEQAEFRSPKTGMARGMATSGVLRDVGDLQKIKAGTEIPPYGTIIVIPRGAAPSGHTCFSLGTGGNGRVMCLHGNWGWTMTRSWVRPGFFMMG